MEKTAPARSLSELEFSVETAETGNPRVPNNANPQTSRSLPASPWSFWLYVLGISLFLGSVYLLEILPWKLDPIWELRLRRYLLGATAFVAILAFARVIERYVIDRVTNPVSRFNLKRVARLGAALILVFLMVSILFVNWYAAVVSLGLISLILGFALQIPISSFVAWVFILLRAPYRVGDRIEIGELRGDVIDVSYLDTTVWEIGGRHLTTEHPSGRLIRFPNTTVFSEPVINYSWPLFPYIWNEIVFEIAYESDLAFITRTVEQIATAELGEAMASKVASYREILAKTPVNHVEVHDKPVVIFRPNPNTWIEAVVRYLVHPKEAGAVKQSLTAKLLAALNAAPDKVLFPKSNMR
jgi:small-conductance mechanosensitive channel